MSSVEGLLVLEDVSYSYLERFPALDRVSLSIASGEKVALLGANGCGKSTLLKVLDGLVIPDSGTYRAFGGDVTEASLEDEQFNEAFRSRVGFIFQNTDAQVFSPTVRDEIAFGPLNMGLSSEVIEARIADTLQMLDIVALADRAPYQLSGGQKKRVAIASVLVMRPSVLLLDEPTAALDPRTKHWLVDLLDQLHRVGRTIVLATHDLDLVPLVADRCIIFGEDHRIIADGPPETVLRDHQLLLDANLLHEHDHEHNGVRHRHLHGAEHHESAELVHEAESLPTTLP